jgi:hypothetical protein
MRTIERNYESIDAQTAAVLAAKTPAERLAIAGGMWRFARDMLRSTLGRTHPEWNEVRLAQEVARRLSHGAV